MAKLPRAVEEQGKRADDLLKQFVAQDPNAVPPVPGNTDPAAPPVTPAPVIVSDPNNPTPPVTPPIEPPVTPPVVAPPGTCPECAKWEQKYRVLQGKYDKEVPRLNGRIQYLENQNQDLQTKLTATPPPALDNPSQLAPTQPTNFSDALKTSEDPTLKTFRENFPDVAGPLGKIFDDFGNQILKKADERVSAIEKTSADTKQESFMRDIVEAHPDWQEICQGDPQWTAWLNKQDRYGMNRLEALRKANAKFDSKAVINLLTDFKKETGTPPSTPSTPGSDPKSLLVSPGSGPSGPSTGAPGAGQGPEPVARSFITQFSIDVARGKYRGREKEAQEIQAKIDAAVSAGKVLNK